jgi:hypothetical protein
MTLHVYQSAKTPELFGFTTDPTGKNLPAEFGKWESVGDTIPIGTTMASTSTEIATQIKCSGFTLVKGHALSSQRLPQSEGPP